MRRFKEVLNLSLLLICSMILIVGCDGKVAPDVSSEVLEEMKPLSNFEVTDSNYQPRSIIYAAIIQKDSLSKELAIDQMEELIVKKISPKKELSSNLKELVVSVLDAYLGVKDGFYEEDSIKIETNINALNAALEEKQFKNVDPISYKVFEESLGRLKYNVDQLIHQKGQKQKQTLAFLSDDLIYFLIESSVDLPKLFVYYCPNSNNNDGANWLSLIEKAENPYVGKRGEGCGALLGVLDNTEAGKMKLFKRKKN